MKLKKMYFVKFKGGSSENECSSVGSRVNIHQKLQEKKQKQLAELKIIEEEIKQGKLGGPTSNSLLSTEDIYNSLARQPIPRTKKHVEPIMWPPSSPDLGDIDDNGEFQAQQSLEMNANINGNLNKLPNYKQNIGDLSNNLGALNTLGALNNMSTYGLLSRMSPQNINSLGIYSQNIDELGDLGGLSPIMSSDNGSVPRQIVPKKRRDDSSRINHGNMYPETNLGFRAIQNRIPNQFRPPYPHHVVPPPRTKQNIPVPRSQTNRSKTPEILLSPHYLDNSRVYYDWGDRYFYRTRDPQLDDDVSTLQRRHEPNSVSDNENVIDSQCEQQDADNPNIYKSYRIPSDIDSQISLPRSYTLPREFKYYRRCRARKQIKNDHFVASTNSSDGKFSCVIY